MVILTGNCLVTPSTPTIHCLCITLTVS